MKKVNNRNILLILLGYFALVALLLSLAVPGEASTKGYKSVPLEPKQSDNMLRGRWVKADDCTIYGEILFKDGSLLTIYFPRNILCPQK